MGIFHHQVIKYSTWLGIEIQKSKSVIYKTKAIKYYNTLIIRTGLLDSNSPATGSMKNLSRICIIFSLYG